MYDYNGTTVVKLKQNDGNKSDAQNNSRLVTSNPLKFSFSCVMSITLNHSLFSSLLALLIVILNSLGIKPLLSRWLRSVLCTLYSVLHASLIAFNCVKSSLFSFFCHDISLAVKIHNANVPAAFFLDQHPGYIS